MKRIIVLISFLFTSFVSFGQEQQPIGFFVESGNGSTVCTAYKTFGYPVYYSVRSSSPYIFFETLDQTRACLKKVKGMMENYKRNVTEAIPYFVAQNSPAPYIGEYNSLVCKEWRNKNGLTVFYEFVFLSSDGISEYVKETPMQACLSAVVFSQANWQNTI